MPDEPQVTFQEKSFWQKDDCINRSAEHDCPNPAILEAFVRFPGGESRVRCCADPQCKEVAKKLAILGIPRLGLSAL